MKPQPLTEAPHVRIRKEMQLPEGKTCGDCAHVKRCLGLGYTPSASYDSCDFHPNRFTPKE